MLDLMDRNEGDVVVVEVEGKMNTTDSPEAGAYLDDLLAEGATKILLNLAGVDFVASTGLRVILATGKKLAASGGKMVICELNPTVKEVFRMSGFSQMFTVTETEAEGLAAF
jgi:anti-anti-sigma factor